MDKELRETLSKVADYNKLEKERVTKAGNIAFGLTFAICAAVIIIQLLMVGELAIVAGETAVLLVGGAAYIGVMTYNGVWETGSRFKSTPFTDALIAVICAGVFAVALVICYIRLGATTSQAVHSALIFFVGIAIVGFGVLRILACFNHKRREKSMPDNETVLVKEQQPVNVFIADGNMQAEMIISTLKDNGIMAYGQDDRVCAFTSLLAMLETKDVKRTACCILVDKEEIGSVGATGMHSRFFENTVAELLALTEGESDLKVRRALMNSRMLSSDVSAAYDPMYAEVFEKRSSAFFGKGLVFNKFTGARGKSSSNDANAEYLAKIRNAMDAQSVAYQFAELGKVDAGGGGTIAYIMANYGMEVIDSGVAVLSMHAPWEVTSKADVYEAYKGYKAFIEEMR